MPNSRNTSQCSHCMACKARSDNRTSHVSCKCANLRQQLPQLDRPADPAHCLPRRTTTAGSLPADIPAHVHAAQQAHHKAGNVSMCTTAPGSQAVECSLTRRNCPWAVPPDSGRSGMTSAPSAAVAKHVQLPQHSSNAWAARRVLQIDYASDLQQCHFASCPTLHVEHGRCRLACCGLRVCSSAAMVPCSLTQLALVVGEGRCLARSAPAMMSCLAFPRDRGPRARNRGNMEAFLIPPGRKVHWPIKSSAVMGRTVERHSKNNRRVAASL